MPRIEAGTKLYIVARQERFNESALIVHELLVQRGGETTILVEATMVLSFRRSISVGPDGGFHNPLIQKTPEAAIRAFIKQGEDKLQELQRSMTEVSNKLSEAQVLLVKELASQ